jgi:hypothetical protein
MNVHEVRKLRVCLLCSKLGIHKPSDPATSIPLLICVHSNAVSKRDRRYVHPRCYIRNMGIANLLTLPAIELEAIRLNDVPNRVMKAILNKQSERE